MLMDKIESAQTLEELDRAVGEVLDRYPFLEGPDATYEELVLVASRNNMREAERLMRAAVRRWWSLREGRE